MTKHFGDLIREHREQLGWSQAHLARRAHLSGPTLVRNLELTGNTRRDTARQVIETLIGPAQLGVRELQLLASAYLFTEQQQEYAGARSVIGLLVSSIDESTFWGRVAGAIEAAASASHLRVVICQHRNDIDRHVADLQFFDTLQGVVGVISAPPYGITPYGGPQVADLDHALRRLLGHGIPVVFIERQAPTTIPIPFVTVDNAQMAAKGVRLLLAEGHQRIGGLFNVPLLHSSQQERYEAYRTTLEECGFYRDELVRSTDPVLRYRRPDQRGGLEKAKELLDQAPTAVFCATYYLTLNVMQAARMRNLRVPEDLSIIGVDNLPELELAGPGITSVYYDVEQFGLQAFMKLNEFIEDPPADRSLAEGAGNCAEESFDRGLLTDCDQAGTVRRTSATGQLRCGASSNRRCRAFSRLTSPRHFLDGLFASTWLRTRAPRCRFTQRFMGPSSRAQGWLSRRSQVLRCLHSGDHSVLGSVLHGIAESFYRNPLF